MRQIVRNFTESFIEEIPFDRSVEIDPPIRRIFQYSVAIFRKVAGKREEGDVTGKEEELEELLRRVAASDRVAFRVLYDRTSGKLFGVCLRICRQRSLAEEALQEAFLEIWRRAGNFRRDRGKPSTWLAILARHRAIDALRRQTRHAGVGKDEDAHMDIVDVSVATDGGTEALALKRCLELLDDEPRQAVLLAYREGYSREELAERFGTPVNTMKSRLRRTLEVLRQCLEQ